MLRGTPGTGLVTLLNLTLASTAFSDSDLPAQPESGPSPSSENAPQIPNPTAIGRSWCEPGQMSGPPVHNECTDWIIANDPNCAIDWDCLCINELFGGQTAFYDSPCYGSVPGCLLFQEACIMCPADTSCPPGTELISALSSGCGSSDPEADGCNLSSPPEQATPGPTDLVATPLANRNTAVDNYDGLFTNLGRKGGRIVHWPLGSYYFEGPYTVGSNQPTKVKVTYQMTDRQYYKTGDGGIIFSLEKREDKSCGGALRDWLILKGEITTKTLFGGTKTIPLAYDGPAQVDREKKEIRYAEKGEYKLVGRFGIKDFKDRDDKVYKDTFWIEIDDRVHYLIPQ